MRRNRRRRCRWPTRAGVQARERAAAYHVLLDVDQLIELFLAFDGVDVVSVKFVDGVFALDAYVLGQLVGARDADLHALGDLVGQFVEHADGPVGRGQTQPANFGQFHVATDTVWTVRRVRNVIAARRPGPYAFRGSFRWWCLPPCDRCSSVPSVLFTRRRRVTGQLISASHRVISCGGAGRAVQHQQQQLYRVTSVPRPCRVRRLNHGHRALIGPFVFLP